MKLSLFYRGPLKSNADAKTKHILRKHFHDQLRRAIEYSPYFVAHKHSWIGGMFSGFSELNSEKSGDHQFLALAGNHVVGVDTSKKANSTVELDITMLRPGPSGLLLTGGGDIDNRLKTLFDALQIPDENQAKRLTSSDIPSSPMCCLMSDDKLITDVRVSTGQLLDVDDNSVEVVLIITAIIHGGLNKVDT
jgi:hypothetical protein